MHRCPAPPTYSARDHLNPLRTRTHTITRMSARSVIRGRAVGVRHHDVRTSYAWPGKQCGSAATLTLTARTLVIISRSSDPGPHPVPTSPDPHHHHHLAAKQRWRPIES